MSSDPPVTQRWPGDQKQITARYSPSTQSSTPTNTETSIPLLVDRYQIKYKLNQASGEAELFHCLDQQSQQAVVVKHYLPGFSPKAEVVKQLHGLSHPNIVRLITYGQWQQRFYEVMEYCAGGTLFDCMPIAPQQLKIYIADVIAGLHYCHQQGIIHRDVKPSNLLFRQTQQQLVLGDFGISSYLDTDHPQITQSAANLTLDYSAPELLDQHIVSAATDYYALGITILHLLAGRSPFHQMAPTHVLVAHLKAEIPINEDLPDDYQRLIAGLLAFDPQQRWGYREVNAWCCNQLDQLNQPLIVGTHTIYTLAELNQLLLTTHDKTLQQQLTTLFWDNHISQWIQQILPKQQATTLQQHIDDIQNRLKLNQNKHRALFALIYVLDPQRPFNLTPTITIRHPNDIEAILAQYPSLANNLQHQLYNGHLEEWIQAAQFEHWQQDVEFIKDCRLSYLEDMTLGSYALRWHYNPQLAFPFGRHQVSEPSQLAELIDANEHNTIKGLELLQRGWIRAWLISSKRLKEPHLFDQIMTQTQPPNAKLEAVLRILKPDLTPPKLNANPALLNFGHYTLGEHKQLMLTFSNHHRGYLYGTAVPTTPNLSLDQHIIQGNSTSILFTLHSFDLAPGKHRQPAINIETNGGHHTLDMIYEVEQETEENDLLAFLDTMTNTLKQGYWILFLPLLVMIFSLTMCNGYR